MSLVSRDPGAAALVDEQGRVVPEDSCDLAAECLDEDVPFVYGLYSPLRAPLVLCRAARGLRRRGRVPLHGRDAECLERLYGPGLRRTAEYRGLGDRALRKLLMGRRGVDIDAVVMLALFLRRSPQGRAVAASVVISL